MELGGMWLPWSTLEGELMCTPWPYVNDECLSRGRGILPWEYSHLCQQQHSELDLNASIIHAVHDGYLQDAAEESHFALARHIVEIDAATEAAALQPLQDTLVMLLDDLVHVVFSHNTSEQMYSHTRFSHECTVLDTAAYTAIFDIDGNRGQTEFGARPMAELDLPHRPTRLSKGRLHRRDHAVIKT